MKIITTPDRVELSNADIVRILVEAVARETGREVNDQTVIFTQCLGSAVAPTARVELRAEPGISPVSPPLPRWKIQYRYDPNAEWRDDDRGRYATEKSALDFLRSVGGGGPYGRVVPA